MFLVVMLVLWTLVAGVVAGNGREMLAVLPDVALYGARTGYWLIVGFALFDHVARELVKGGANRFLFALFAVPYVMATWPLISAWPITGYPIDLQGNIAAPLQAAPFLAVMLCYLVRPDRAQPQKADDGEEEAVS